MAAAHPTPASAIPDIAIPGSLANPLQIEVDDLKIEVSALKDTVTSLLKEIEDLKRVKGEPATSPDPLAGVRVKAEPSEAGPLGDVSEGTTGPDPRENVHDRGAEVDREEQEQAQVDRSLGVIQNATSDDIERATGAPPRRQSTEEPPWNTPPRGDIVFRVNPDYVPRSSGKKVDTLPTGFPTPQPQPSEGIPPSLLPPLPPSPPIVRPRTPFGIIPASRAKRKRNFEVVVEIPAKRFKSKPSHYQELVASSDTPTVSTSHSIPGDVVFVPRAPVQIQNAENTQKLNKPKKAPKVPESKKVHEVPIRLTKQPIRKIKAPSFKIDLDPKIRDVTVSRAYMMTHFGAHKVFSFSKPPHERVQKHGYDHFLFINGKFSPQAPSTPGKAGLVTLFKERPWPTREYYRVFFGSGALSVRWGYMGLYRAKRLAAWTPEEIKRHPLGVKHNWATTVRDAAWARPMISRIMLRMELHREPTEAEVDSQEAKLRTKVVEPPPLEIISAAFENGDEKLYPWRLHQLQIQQEVLENPPLELL